MVQGDESEGEEAPEDEGVGDAGEGALLDDLGLAEDFPDEVPDAAADWEKTEAGIAARVSDLVNDEAEALPEEGGRGEEEGDEEELFGEGEMRGFGEGAHEREGGAEGSRCIQERHGESVVPSAYLCT